MNSMVRLSSSAHYCLSKRDNLAVAAPHKRVFMKEFLGAYIFMGSFIADVYDACLYSWNLDRPTTEWYNDMRPSVRRILAFIHKAVISSWFEYTICKFILLIVKTSVKTISDEVIQTIFFSALRSGTINTLIVLSMPSFLLLGGPISAFFAGPTAELHYCTLYSPFPSYK